MYQIFKNFSEKHININQETTSKVLYVKKKN